MITMFKLDEPHQAEKLDYFVFSRLKLVSMNALQERDILFLLMQC